MDAVDLLARPHIPSFLLLLCKLGRRSMKIQCDVCEKAAAEVICCADEAALCASCDVEVHAANKLASKHRRLLLDCLPSELPRCDICQDKAAFIFCVEDRALFCKDCDESIHVAGTLSGDHHRYLSTGIHVALTNQEAQKNSKNREAPSRSSVAAAAAPKDPPPAQQVPPFLHSPWAVDELLQLSDYEAAFKKGSPVGFGDFDYFEDIKLFGEQVAKGSLATAAAEVPELSLSHSQGCFKKQRLEASDEDEFSTVPDLG